MIKVLLVDDSPIVTKMVSNYLSEKGYKVDFANSPFGVSNKIKEFQPQILLMDLGLPGLSGENLINLCRKNHGDDMHLQCRVVLFSSANEDEMKDMVNRGLAHDYFMKGGSLKDLENKINVQMDALSRRSQ